MALIAQSTAVVLASLAADQQPFDPNKVSPGVGGFLVVALLGVVLFFLGLDLVRRLRRIKYRDEIRTELAAELAERDRLSDEGSEAPEAPAPPDAPDDKR